LTKSSPEWRVQHAALLAEKLADIVLREDPDNLQWRHKLLDIRDVLVRAEGGPQAALQNAAAMFVGMYKGPRNFSDFYIYRRDEDARIEANNKFTEMTDDLQKTLRDS